MPNKAKTRPAGGTAGQAETGTEFAGQLSQSHFIAVERKKQACFRVADLLSYGAANGITLPDLVSLTGMDERELRRRIHLERKQCADEHMIVSNNKDGYFLPEHSEELKHFANSMAHRAAEILTIARAAEDALARMEGQERVEGW